MMRWILFFWVEVTAKDGVHYRPRCPNHDSPQRVTCFLTRVSTPN